MIKRPQRGESEEDILRMQDEYLAHRAKNPKLQPAAQCIKVDKGVKKSLFVKNRQKVLDENFAAKEEQTSKNTAAISAIEEEIQKKIVGTSEGTAVDNFAGVILGDIVERQVSAPIHNVDFSSEKDGGFPTVKRVLLNNTRKAGKSLFASSGITATAESDTTADLTKIYGNKSVIVTHSTLASEVHKTNIDFLSNMTKNEILAEREQLLNSIDPSLLALLKKKRQEKSILPASACDSITSVHNVSAPCDNQQALDVSSVLAPSNAAVEILQQSEAERWIHFDVVETDKLQWMRDIPEDKLKMKAGEQFEARFDWKGVLLPYSDKTLPTKDAPANAMPANVTLQTDDRELYLHGEEPHRPGYTLQELFRLARSNVMQQRISAYGAIGGILSIYNQGFYDNVLDLPISKLFFLLRFGLDDNTPAMLEVVSKALAYLLFNEADETLLDFIYDNPGCHWQPVLTAFDSTADAVAIENLQEQMQQLQMNGQESRSPFPFSSDFEDSENESKTSMSDFHLAETNIIDCLLRTNILQRIYYILEVVKPNNSAVSACLKILIRLARTSAEVAGKIVSNNDLVHCLFEYFLPDVAQVDAKLDVSQYYYYPQYLCLKLFRVLIAQNLGIAARLLNMPLTDILKSYLYYRGDMKDAMVKVQIECLRIVRCLLLLRIDDTLYSNLVSAFNYMLHWHCNYLKFEAGGPYLLRQHASALLIAISSEPCRVESDSALSDMLNKCSCTWFYRATRSAITEFSQATLLSACLNVVAWKLRCDEADHFRDFNTKYLPDFLRFDSFKKHVQLLITSSVILRKPSDRRCTHPPLPNVGAVLLHTDGPQLIIPQTYAVYLMSAIWSLLELQINQHRHAEHTILIDALMTPDVVDGLVKYLQLISTNLNHYLCSNFYAKIEVKFVSRLLGFSDLMAHFKAAQILQLVYNYLCCLSAEHILEIEYLFDTIIFNTKYLNVTASTLNKWREIFIGLVQSHYIVVEPSNLSMSKSAQSNAILSRDWPYFFFKMILQSFIDSSPQTITADFTEREILEMTLTLVGQLEDASSNLVIVAPTEELMYTMIAFMGPGCEFLSDDVRPLLRARLLRLYTKHKDYTFRFDTASLGKCSFESLYSLFVDHFQAASYGDALFGSLVLVPLAQKYDNKWRRRMWSDYASALCYLHCDETLLLGGMEAYLEPVEQDVSLVRAYALALSRNDVRPGSIPYKIAKYHVTNFKEPATCNK